MLVLPGVLAVAGYQNRDKLGAMLTPPRAPAPTRTKARLLTLGANRAAFPTACAMWRTT